MKHLLLCILLVPSACRSEAPEPAQTTAASAPASRPAVAPTPALRAVDDPRVASAPPAVAIDDRNARCRARLQTLAKRLQEEDTDDIGELERMIAAQPARERAALAASLEQAKAMTAIDTETVLDGFGERFCARAQAMPEALMRCLDEARRYQDITRCMTPSRPSLPGAVAARSFDEDDELDGDADLEVDERINQQVDDELVRELMAGEQRGELEGPGRELYDTIAAEIRAELEAEKAPRASKARKDDR